VLDVMHVEGGEIRAGWRAGEDERTLTSIGCSAASGAVRCERNSGLKTKNPDIKPGPVMPQRTSGHDDQCKDSRTS
jgi:hypothetical protein